MLSNIETGYQMQFGPDARDIQGKTILVMGDGEGLGSTTASLLAQHGAIIFFVTRDAAALQAALCAARKNGNSMAGMVADLRHPERIPQIFTEIERRYGPVHAVVNTLSVDSMAGWQEGDATFVKQLEECQNACTQEAILHMQRNTRGHIINIGQSISNPAARGLAASLRQQARKQGIRITLIEPVGPFAIPAVDVAQCVINSLIQPVGADVVFLEGSQEVRM
jgi:NAD(P)-dependent dehydrogenase (short-subunit alcohol dehydrogenase family)